MFLCEPCSKKMGATDFDWIICFPSFGPCESCHKTTHCIDYHGYKYRREETDNKEEQQPATE